MKNTKGVLIHVAARLAKGDAISAIDELCEEQKTISTAKLKRFVDDVREELIKEAINIKNAIN
jgi:hypothetical protein